VIGAKEEIMSKVKVGIIGCGVIGKLHLQGMAQAEHIEIAAIADLRPEVRQAIAEQYHVPAAYAEGRELLADPRVEAVVLAMPTAGRVDLALEAFAQGKHVLVEKPVGMNAGEVRRMVAAKGKLVAGCCSSRERFLPSAQASADVIASGALGNLRVLRVSAFSADGGTPKAMPPAWRLIKALNGGGILLNWGCYDLDYMLGLVGWTLRPRLVLGQIWAIPPVFAAHAAPGSDAETHLTALVRCDGGIVLNYERGEYMARHSSSIWEITGDRGTLHLRMTPEKGKQVILETGTPENGVASQVIWEGEEDNMFPHYQPAQDFAAAILEGRAPKTSLEQALVVQQISDAIYESAASGKAVEILCDARFAKRETQWTAH
jgi:predicted dehydrogenase